MTETRVRSGTMRILIHCLRAAIRNEGANEELSGLLDYETDWNELLALAAKHRVVPILCSVLTREYAGRLPDEFLQRLKALDRSNAMLGESLETVLFATTDRLLAAGVRSLPWGGSALRMSLSSAGIQRQNWGVTILVDPQASGTAIQSLEEAGFRPWKSWGGPFPKTRRRIEGSEALVETGGGGR